MSRPVGAAQCKNVPNCVAYADGASCLVDGNQVRWRTCAACAPTYFLDNLSGACQPCSSLEESYVSLDGRCTACTPCAAGFYELSECTANKDRVCAVCAPGCTSCNGPKPAPSIVAGSSCDTCYWDQLYNNTVNNNRGNFYHHSKTPSSLGTCSAVSARLALLWGARAAR
jgi:hypothetical protein